MTGKKTARTGRSAPKTSVPKRTQSKTHDSLWERLQCREKWPRRWWYPLRPQSSQKAAGKTVEKNYEECVATVRRTMLGILGFCLFAIVVIFGTPDSALITSEAKVKLPFAESEIVFLGFLIAAPALLIVLITYLHIFDTSRREFENTYKISPVPTLFTLNRPLPKLLTYIIFYWLVPIVLAAITWKALARLWWGLPLLAVTIAVAGGLVWMQIRRRPAHGRFLKNLPLWVVLVGLMSVACFAAWEAFTGLVGPGAWHHDAFRRPLYLFRVDLAGKWLVGADLRDADLRFASLVGTNLSSANLQGAKLGRAQLKGADLTGAQLPGQDLMGLQGVKNLRSANLQGADLFFAKLQGADLGLAQLQGATLTSAQLEGANLTGAQLQGANLSKARLQGANLRLARLQGADLSSAKLEGATLASAQLKGADLYDAQLQGANLSKAQLQGADLRWAQLQGADLTGAELRGADLKGAEVWLASFPRGLDNQSPAPLGVADLDFSPLTAKAKAELKKRLQANITDEQLLARFHLDPILRDGATEWKHEDKWNQYVSQAREPPPDELVDFLADMACGDRGGYIANSMAKRAVRYSADEGRRQYGKPLAEALLDEKNCEGAKALTDETRAALRELVSAAE